MIEMLTLEEFGEAVETVISEELGILYDVKLMKVIKNNNRCLLGLCIRCVGSNIAPTIYLNDYYREYEEEEDFTGIVKDILQVYRNSNKGLPVVKDDFTWEGIKKNVILRLINYDKNEELLQGVPHKRVYEDLAITFHVLVGSDKEGVQTYRINNELFCSFNIEIDVLYDTALHNSMTYFPTSLRNINEMIVSMIAPEGVDNEEYAELFDTTVPEEGRGIMYVLSNSIGVYGATAMLYPDMIKEFADTMGADLYILPSSLHEVILVLDYGCSYRGFELQRMVVDVNRTVLQSEDILSDNVYKYYRATNKIEKL
ncbi:DUF5688 family protein [Anaerocolumna sp.]|uniref:DUF5688 family protein n=1 Tax=Anaerocolumna sp. TaxID=2041569 RepID=UPI0028A957EA|nr:DUF5688 family protein [Anaerocolumna sp.]